MQNLKTEAVMKFLNKILSALKWLWARPEVQELFTELQTKAWADLKDISIQAIAEAKAGMFSSGEEKRKAAFKRIAMYAFNKGMKYPDSVINWTLEHAYQRFEVK